MTLLPLLFGGALLLIGLLSGRWVERRHFAQLREREGELADIRCTNLKRAPGEPPPASARLVAGNVVISTDYFKSVCGALRAIIGGRVRSYETLVERGRREALVRMLDDARSTGARSIINVRFETLPIARFQNGRGLMGVEVLAYGTALHT